MHTPIYPVRALLIDDSELDYLLLRHTLYAIHEQAVSLDWLATYAEGLEAILAAEHDIYLIDYRLGLDSGMDLLRTARAGGCRAPIIMLTGQGSTQVDLEAMQSGATDYLDKNDITAPLLERSLRYAIANKRAENELARLYERVSRLEQTKTDMLRIASHDLRNPLMSVMSALQLLQMDHAQAFDPDQQRYLNTIQREAQRMHQIIRDILSAERAEIYAAGQSQEEINLCELVRGVCADFASRAEEHAQVLNMLLPDTPLLVHGDAVQLQEALENLISNAIKYTPAGGRITIQLFQQGQQAVLKVEDTGYGIAPEQQHRLFRPFSRIRTRENMAIEGTGLGLHLVKNIIERHNGQIIFDSVHGQGSVFGFALPLVSK